MRFRRLDRAIHDLRAGAREQPRERLGVARAVDEDEVGGDPSRPALDPVPPVDPFVQPERERPARPPHDRAEQHVRPTTMTDHNIKILPVQKPPQPAPGAPDGPRPAEPHRPEQVDRRPLGPQRRGEFAVEAERELRLHPGGRAGTSPGSSGTSRPRRRGSRRCSGGRATLLPILRGRGGDQPRAPGQAGHGRIRQHTLINVQAPLGHPALVELLGRAAARAAARRSRRPGSDVRRRAAAASDTGSSTGTVRPVSSCRLTHGTPLWGIHVLITGQPHAIASTWVRPNASLRAFDGNQKASAAR